jgi:hypothetical protein
VGDGLPTQQRPQDREVLAHAADGPVAGQAEQGPHHRRDTRPDARRQPAARRRLHAQRLAGLAAESERFSDLLDHPSPEEALRTWLRAVAVHATAMRGLVAAQMAAQPGAGTGDALAACHDAILSTGAALLTRAQHEAGTPADLDIADLLKPANAIAWASERTPEDPGVLDRLFALVSVSLRPGPQDVDSARSSATACRART